MSHAIETASAEQLRTAGLAIVAVEELDGLCHSLRSTSDELMLTRSKLEDLEKRLLHSQLTVEQQTEMYRRARVDADAMEEEVRRLRTQLATLQGPGATDEHVARHRAGFNAAIDAVVNLFVKHDGLVVLVYGRTVQSTTYLKRELEARKAGARGKIIGFHVGASAMQGITVDVILTEVDHIPAGLRLSARIFDQPLVIRVTG